jgi:hypothetical protein
MSQMDGEAGEYQPSVRSPPDLVCLAPPDCALPWNYPESVVGGLPRILAGAGNQGDCAVPCLQVYRHRITAQLVP